MAKHDHTDGAEQLTISQELARMMDAPDEDEPSMTLRQALCKAMIREAKQGNFKAFEWVYQASGEKRRDLFSSPLI